MSMLPRRDPLVGKRTRIIVQEQNAAGVWLDAQAIMVDRRGPETAFSTGALGWHGAGQIPIHGRDGRIQITFTETGSKGYGNPKPKASDLSAEERKVEASGAVKAFYETAEEVGATRGKRIA